MNKLMTVVAASVCAVSLSGAAVAAENSSVENKEAEELREEDDKLFEAGFDADLNTAYIWRNVVQTDKPVFQPCVWADFTGLDPFWFGFSYWQGWDLSSDRSDIYRRRFNESDYNLHVGATAWETEDGDMSLEFELGHEWYTYHFDRDRSSPSTREFYLNGKFKNPLVNVYGQVSWMYDDIGECESGFFYELGFNKECDLATFIDVEEETFMLGLDWNTSFGDRNYLYCLLDEVDCVYDDEGELVSYDRPFGFAGTTVKAYLTWNIKEWMSLTGTIAYTGLLNQDARREFNVGGSGDDKDVLWGGLRLSFSY